MTTISLSRHIIVDRLASVNFPRINWKIVYLSGILLFLPMLVFYVYSINQLTSGVYLIKNYEKEINLLLEENKILETNFTKTSLLGQVVSRAKELSFEKTTNIKYVQILESSLAKVPKNYQR